MQVTSARFIFCSLGIFICYFYYGIIQEKITRSTYGLEKEPFLYPQSLVFVQCVVNSIFARVVMSVSAEALDNTPTFLYAACAFSYLAAMISSNHALQFVSYPTQVISKSCKPIPIMLLGILLFRKVYPWTKYLFVTMIVCGVSMFLYRAKDVPVVPSSGIGFGEVLLVFSLAMDGTTGAIQDKIRARYECSSNRMMLHMNLWSLVFSVIGLLLSGEIFSFYLFVKRFPNLLFDLASYSVASALGQYFIFMTVSQFGPLTCSVLTTTRKFFTILASVIYFRNPLTLSQWLGAIMVFAGLTLDSGYGKMRRHEPTA
ncbi:unnamed protein product [Soboliphyme baturini]|uniref:Solute carrier family 35 member B1 n=1 Tax=Soboliphyme baturini TaxID=241478 RepID=A0A183J8J4_9BILA|nr:unnamed protein product [Soboliphyme baturini]